MKAGHVLGLVAVEVIVLGERDEARTLNVLAAEERGRIWCSRSSL